MFSFNLMEGKVITSLIHLFNHWLFYYLFPSIISESLIQIDCIGTENKILCAFFCLWPLGRKGVELQRPNHPVPLFAHLYYGHHHAMFPPQCLLQPGQPGGRLLRHCVLHPLPSAHLLLHLARPHHQGHEDPGGRCLRLISPSKNEPFCTKFFFILLAIIHFTFLCRAYCPKWLLALGLSTSLVMKSRVWVYSGTTSRPVPLRGTSSPFWPPSPWWAWTLCCMLCWPGTWTTSSLVSALGVK